MIVGVTNPSAWHNCSTAMGYLLHVRCLYTAQAWQFVMLADSCYNVPSGGGLWGEGGGAFGSCTSAKASVRSLDPHISEK